jgi:hypothetical protein
VAFATSACRRGCQGGDRFGTRRVADIGDLTLKLTSADDRSNRLEKIISNNMQRAINQIPSFRAPLLKGPRRRNNGADARRHSRGARAPVIRITPLRHFSPRGARRTECTLSTLSPSALQTSRFRTLAQYFRRKAMSTGATVVSHSSSFFLRRESGSE